METKKRHPRTIICLFASGLLLCASVGNTLTRPGLSIAEWREDLDFLAAQMSEIHPNLFFSVPREEFDASVSALRDRLHKLSDNQILAELHKIAALPSRNGRDGHTQLSAFDPRFDSYLPLQFFMFDDGVFIIDAMPHYRHLVGTRILRVGRRDMDETYRSLEPLISRDNDATTLERFPAYLMNVQLLGGARVIDRNHQVDFMLERADGIRLAASVTPVTIFELVDWLENRGSPTPDETLYLSNPDENFWFTILASSGTLYIQYNSVQPTTEAGESIELFSQRLLSAARSSSVNRIVIDLRLNGGGNQTTYQPLLDALSSSPAQRAGRLYAIVGRGTFSAATKFVGDLKRRTSVILVGEPTGGSPNSYGDPVSRQLPHSGFTLFVSTRDHQDEPPDDPRITFEPDIPVSLSSRDFFAGRDPSLETVITHASSVH